MARKVDAQLQGELQMEVMRALWHRAGPSNVEEVRKALPSRHRGAYTTVQTILNRLAERGLLSRVRQGNLILYSPLITEADYYSRSVRQTLAQASDDARRTALAQLVGDLAPGELDEMKALSREVAQRRGSSTR